MHPYFSAFHRTLIWVILPLGLFVIYRFVAGWLLRKEKNPLDEKIAATYVLFLHLQFVIGVILYFFLSPLTTALSSEWIKSPIYRFYNLEHPLLMFLGIAIAQWGRSVSKRAKNAHKGFRIGAIAYILSMILLLVGIPWNKVL